MKDITIKFIAVFSLVLVSNMVYAGEKGRSYFGLGYHGGSYESDVSRNASFDGLNAEFGYYLEHNIALVGSFLLGASGESINYKDSGIFIDIDMKYIASLMLRGDIPIGQKLRLYGLAGLSYGTIEASADTSYIKEDLSASNPGISYGLGIEGNLARDLLIGAEYVSYLREDDFEYSAYNISVRQLF